MTLSHRLRVADAQGPNIVRDGLAFHIDAQNSASYDPTANASAAVDLVTGTLTSSFWGVNVSYGGNTTQNPSASDHGHWTFANHASYASNNAPFGIVFASSDFDLPNYSSFSWDMWIRPTSSNYGKVLGFEKHNNAIGSFSSDPQNINLMSSHFVHDSGVSPNYASIAFQHMTASSSNWTDFQITSPSIGTWNQNTWRHFAFANEATGFGFKYHWVDGTRVNNTRYGNSSFTSFGANVGSPGTFYMYIGGSEGVNSYQVRYEGHIAIIRYYKNKVLSDSEVAQNWNEEKALFGR